MLPRMRTLGHRHEIIRIIVDRVPVAVMHDLTTTGLRDYTMLTLPTSVCLYHDTRPPDTA